MTTAAQPPNRPKSAENIDSKKGTGSGQKPAQPKVILPPPASSPPVSDGKLRLAPHMAKVEKVAAGLPPLSPDAQATFDSVKKLQTAELHVLRAHLDVEARRRSTAPAVGPAIEVGDEVKILVEKNTKYIGKTGVVHQVNRIRAHIQVGASRAYCFLTDLELLSKRDSKSPKAAAETEKPTVIDLTAEDPHDEGDVTALDLTEEENDKNTKATG
jgi:hypothetical protein